MQKILVNTGNPYEITIGINLDFGKILKPFIKANAILVYDSNLPQKKLMEIKVSFKKVVRAIKCDFIFFLPNKNTPRRTHLNLLPCHRRSYANFFL